jgi:hypothetical protein
MTSGPPNVEKPALVDQNAAARFEDPVDREPQRGKTGFC